MSNNQITPVLPVAPGNFTSTQSAQQDNGGLIPQGESSKMQNDAVSIPPANEVETALRNPGLSVVESNSGCSGSGNCGACASDAPATESQFHSLTICLMFTLNLANSAFDNGAAKTLSKITAGDKVLNLYSPFRKSKEEKGIAAGMFRPMLNRMMEIAAYVNSANILVAGDTANATATIAGSVQSVRNEIQSLFPRIEVEENQVALANDVCASTSWVNALQVEDEAICTHTAVINFQVNAGSFYDEVDRIKTVRTVQSLLNIYAEKNPGVPILFAVALPSDAIEYVENRDLITMMLDEDKFDLYSRKKLMVTDEDWIPSTPAEIEKDMLPEHSDMLLIKMLGEDEAEAAAE